MPWLQFFDEDDELLREFEMSRMAKIMMDPGGTMVLDEAAQDGPTTPRVLMIRGNYAFAKSISDSARDEMKGTTPTVEQVEVFTQEPVDLSDVRSEQKRE